MLIVGFGGILVDIGAFGATLELKGSFGRMLKNEAARKEAKC